MGLAFARHDAQEHYGLDEASALKRIPSVDDTRQAVECLPLDKSVGGMIYRMIRIIRPDKSNKSRGVNDTLSVSDFDLLRVVGKGAFGKVMLVRKKSGPEKNQLYAMKVLRKSMIFAKGQVEHTKAERHILCEIHHPFIVCLRFAFQSDEKLYLVTDFYPGGSLFFHLRKNKGFGEVRSRFYGAELVLALSHLHDNHIVYRDLKLENVLMDDKGHIALTDFGLCKENVENVHDAKLSTFCGTAEYLAPELLRNIKYSAAVDWWSFGVLLFEMVGFKTPFYNRNRKIMFQNIVNEEPEWLDDCDASTNSILRGLLTKAPEKRLGSGGVDELKYHAFFNTIDWDAIMEKAISPDFRPDEANLLGNVPSSYLNITAHDSIDRNANRTTSANFEGFTYAGEKSVLDDAE